ncbi:MAG TPA: prepilin-type N-terminal cleavage/methylation domain-containing protein [Candidatus Paceibacterota bacterium]|nr:prepilin-type N-terminal cleavage/methylation domain-containing protein [Candidatus Paceibacterota bacterium]
MKKGYSLAELMVAVAIVALMATISVASLSSYLKRESLASNAAALANAIREARSRTLASIKGQQYGVQVDSDRFTLFSGPALSSTTADAPYLFASGVRASTAVPVVLFSRVTGNSSASGTIDLYIVGDPAKKRTVSVQGTGLVNLY